MHVDELLDVGSASHPRVVAHRGESSNAPENTLEAALLAWRGGADAWELDVQLSRDGVPVVIHDDSLLRTTDVAVRFAGDPRGDDGFLVGDFDLAELKTLDAGSWFVATGGGPRSALEFGTLAAIDPLDRERYSSGTVRIPTLVEALRWTVDMDWLVNVELKSFPAQPPGLVPAALAALEAAPTSGRVWVSSFDHAVVAEVARRRPDLIAAALTWHPLYRPARYVREELGARAYHVSTLALGAASRAYRDHPSAGSLREADIAELIDAEIPVLAYTVNEGAGNDLADHLIEAGATGVFSDTPSLLVRHWRGAEAPR
jgi:glycerophosphoryl diester phosphodiesterase